MKAHKLITSDGITEELAGETDRFLRQAVQNRKWYEEVRE